MKVEFMLRAEPNFDGTLRVLEYVVADSETKVVGPDGLLKSNFVITERIDEALKKAHPEQYKAFSDYVEANIDSLYALVKATPNTFVNVTQIMNTPI